MEAVGDVVKLAVVPDPRIPLLRWSGILAAIKGSPSPLCRVPPTLRQPSVRRHPAGEDARGVGIAQTPCPAWAASRVAMALALFVPMCAEVHGLIGAAKPHVAMIFGAR